MSVAAPLPADRRARLVDFAARMRSRQMRLAAAAAAMRCALGGALPAFAVAWFWPRQGFWVGAAVAVLAAAAAGLAALRARRVSDALLLRAEDDRATAGLTRIGDGLATWLENDRAGAARPMTDWLADDLDRDIRALPPAAMRQVGRRRLGRLRWILPILILLLLAWLLSLWWQPSWSGALGGKPQVPNDGSPLPAVGAVPTGGEAEVAPQPQPVDANEPRDDRPAAGDAKDEPEQPAEPTPPPLPPAPLLQLPPQQLFAVPEFIADGPTRRMRAHVAEVAGGEAPTAPRTPGDTGTGDGQPPPPPPPDRAEFERAAERAQAARHVPETERAIVRRFFRLLREAAK